MSTALMLALLAELAVQSTASAAPDTRPTGLALTVRCELVIRPAVLDPAERALIRIVRAAALQGDITWVGCRRPGEASFPATLPGAPSSNAFTVVILPAAGAKRLGSSEDQMGMTPRSETGVGRRAYVFYDRVEEFGRYYRTDWGSVLGAAIGHELGHMLLPAPSHSDTGLMRPTWVLNEFQQLERGWLLFTPEQARLIRTRLATAAPPSPGRRRTPGQ